MTARTNWDPNQYLRYADERRRPIDDLLARVSIEAPRLVVDLGCGPGPMTRDLAERWPTARVIGVDSSSTMIDRAQEHAVDGRVEFVLSDLGSYQPDGPVDVVFSNATLHWIPDHLPLLKRFCGWLATQGVIAMQVPDNFAQPSHTSVAELQASEEWQDRIGHVRGPAGSERPGAYLDALLDAGLSADVWQTTYLHLLHGENPVLEWIKGTALRPVLAALAEDPVAERRFLDQLGEKLRAAYPAGEHGTTLPFTRTFAVGVRA